LSSSSSPFKSKLTSSNPSGNDNNSDNNNSILSTSSSLRKTQELSQASLNNLLKNAQLLTPNIKSIIPSSGVQSNLKVFLIIVLIYYYCLKDAQDIKDAF
jgi:hypothetical protein